MADLVDLDLTAPADSLYEGGVKINLMRARLDGLYTILGDITAAEANQLENIGSTTITAAQWVYLGELDQSLTTSSNVQFGNIDMDGNLDLRTQATSISIKDNEAASLDIKEGLTSYLKFVTTDAGEKIITGKPLYISSTYTLPVVDGSADQVIKTDGSGALSWTAQTGGNGGANTALSNLASVAINTSLLSDTTNTDDLGSSGKKWKDLYIDGIGYIDGISGITSFTASGNLDIGAYNLQAATLTADQLTVGGVIIASTAGLLSTDTDLTFSGDTLTATKLITTEIKLEGGTYDTTIVPGTPTASVTYTWPLADGAANEILKTSGAGVLSWVAAGAGDVTAGANLTDNAIVRGNGGSKGVQTSGITITDANVLTLAGNLDMSAGGYHILIPDDSVSAFMITEGVTVYVEFSTSNGAEKILLHKKLEAGAVEIEGTGFDINGGAIDNTTIGATTPLTGVFTTLSLDAVGELRFYDNSNYVGFEAPALSADQIWVLPTADGAANEVLYTDGSGTLGWTTAPGADQALSNLASVTINESLISDTDDTDDLGSTTKEWKDLWIDGTANIDSLVADTADINGGTIDGITSLTAGGDLDIGAHDLRAATLTADGLTATRVIFAGASGLLSDDAKLTWSAPKLSIVAQSETAEGNALWIDLRSTVTSGDLTGVRSRVYGNAASAGANVRGGYLEAKMAAGSKYAAMLEGSLSHADYSAGSIIVSGDVRGFTAHISQGAGLEAANVYGGLISIQTRGDETIGTNHVGLLIRNEAVGGAGRTMNAALKIVDLNMGGGTNGFTYGIDLNGVGIATADIRFSGGQVIVSSAVALTIPAFTLGGKLTGGSSEIEGSNFDIDGGAIDGVAIGASTAITDLDLNCDLEFEAAKDILIIDNNAAALEIKQGANAYVTFVTTDSGEKVTFNKTIDAIGAATISTAQWGYLGACGAGGGQLLAALTAGESTQLEAIGAAEISSTEWGYLAACGAGGGQLLAALTTGESDQLEAIGNATISSAQWGYLGGCSGIIANVVEDTTPQLGGELDCQAHSIGFTQQTATGDGETPIDWKLGNKFYFTFGEMNETFVFTQPTHECNLLLVLKQDAVGGSRTATWPNTVSWPAGTAPTLSTGTNDVDIVMFYWDGTNYHGASILDFSVPA